MALVLLAAGCASTPTAAPADLVIEDVHVIDTALGTVAAHQTVVVRGGRIDAVVSARSSISAAIRVDGRGKYLMPALADMHVHLRQTSHLPLYPSAGVTLVRDMWGSPERLELRERAKADPRWPTVVAGSPGLDGAPPTFEGGPTATTPDEGRAEVRRMHARLREDL